VGLVGVLVCYIAANLSLIAMAGFTLVSRIGRPNIQWDFSTSRRVLRRSLPFFVLIALSVLHFKIDTVMLGLMATLDAVARYEIAYKFLEVSRFIVRPAGMIFLPICTGLVIQQSWPDLQRLVRRLMLGTAALAVGLAVIVAAGADLIIEIVFGADYADSVPILQVLFVSLPAVYLVFVGSVLANSLYLEKTLIWMTCVCLIVNVVANLFVIPRWGGLGAAWTTVATEALLALMVVVLIVCRLRLVVNREDLAPPPGRPYDQIL
jgi:O-antigen/teichoic acid export membrane protein